jgi:hypothetical protein
MRRRDSSEPSKDGPRSISGTVGRSDGEIEDGGVEVALASRSRRCFCAASTSSRIVGMAGFFKEASEIEYETELWRVCEGRTDAIAMLRSKIRALGALEGLNWSVRRFQLHSDF